MEPNVNSPEVSPAAPTPPAAPSGGGRNVVVIGVVVLVVAGMLLAGKYLARNSAPLASNSGNTKGAMAPDFELKDIDGKPVRLSSLRGKAVLLNFWATWCGPCKIEMPWIIELQKQYADQGLVVLGVAMDDDAKDVPAFVKQMGVNYPVLLGNDKVADLYGGVSGLPTTFYIGRDGKIVERVFGLAGHKEIEADIKAALSEGSATAKSNPGEPVVVAK